MTNDVIGIIVCFFEWQQDFTSEWMLKFNDENSTNDVIETIVFFYLFKTILRNKGLVLSDNFTIKKNKIIWPSVAIIT